MQNKNCVQKIPGENEKIKYVLGKISFKKTERENIYTINKDKYDFNLEKKEPLGKRNRLTLSARILHDIIEKLSNLPHIDSYNSAI